MCVCVCPCVWVQFGAGPSCNVVLLLLLLRFCFSSQFERCGGCFLVLFHCDDDQSEDWWADRSVFTSAHNTLMYNSITKVLEKTKACNIRRRAGQDEWEREAKKTTTTNEWGGNLKKKRNQNGMKMDEEWKELFFSLNKCNRRRQRGF